MLQEEECTPPNRNKSDQLPVKLDHLQERGKGSDFLIRRKNHYLSGVRVGEEASAALTGTKTYGLRNLVLEVKLGQQEGGEEEVVGIVGPDKQTQLRVVEVKPDGRNLNLQSGVGMSTSTSYITFLDSFTVAGELGVGFFLSRSRPSPYPLSSAQHLENTPGGRITRTHFGNNAAAAELSPNLNLGAGAVKRNLFQGGTSASGTSSLRGDDSRVSGDGGGDDEGSAAATATMSASVAAAIGF
ncbi:hypothetical protein Tco_0462594 [Tanacetum coccineum]